MLDYLKEIEAMVPPPSKAFSAAGDWHVAENRFGTALPVDYKRFIESYGTGSIGRLPLWVLNAHLESMKSLFDSVVETFKTIFSESPELLPYPLFPASHGLLLWGATGNGDHLFWHTLGKPEAWTVVVHLWGADRFVPFEGNLTKFLWAVLTKPFDGFPAGAFEPPVAFAPSELACSWP